MSDNENEFVVVESMQTLQRQLDGVSAAHAATKASLYTLQRAHMEIMELFTDKESMHEVMLYLKGKRVNVDTIVRAKNICNTKKGVEKKITAEGMYQLGCALTDKETLTINDTSYNKRDMYIKALEIDALHAKSYYSLGLLMADGGSVTINGTRYTKKDCFIKAIESDPQYVYAYYFLGNMLTRNQTVAINGTPYTNKDCYIAAIEIDPLPKNQWTLLGDVMTTTDEPVVVNGVAYTKKECLAKGR